MGWRVIVRASRSAAPTSVGLTYCSVIAQTWERNCWARPSGAGGPWDRDFVQPFSLRDALLLVDLGLEGLELEIQDPSLGNMPCW